MELRHPQYPRITMNPEICTGKPCIRGIRFPVSTLIGYLAGGMSHPKLLETFSFLEEEDIEQALGFAAAQMDERILPLQLAVA